MESFLVLHACVGSLPAMCPQVSTKGGLTHEGFSTEWTSKRLLPHVCSLMFPEGHGAAVGFAAFCAFGGLCSTVHPHVLFKISLMLEGFPAVLAFIGLLLTVCSCMFPEG